MPSGEKGRAQGARGSVEAPSPTRAVTAHRVNAGVNLLLAGSKIGIGWASGSTALLANGVENLADLANNGLAWFAHRAAQVPPDEDHHYGHGNAEALATAAIGAIIFAGGGAVIWRALAGASVAEPGLIGALALGVAATSAVVCEALSRWTHRVARALENGPLRALARDKRSDALTSILVVIGVSASLAGVTWVEPPVAALMGVGICWMGLRSLREGVDVLMDRVDDPELRAQLRDLAQALPGVRGVQQVRVHPLGSELRVDMQISVDGELSVREGHTIAHSVERVVLREVSRVVEVHVHVNPA
jgi:cation diffusion facilitator family transporter